MPKYMAVAEFEHDGKRIAPGTAIELDDVSAAYLLRGGAIKPMVEAEEKAAVKKEKN